DAKLTITTPLATALGNPAQPMHLAGTAAGTSATSALDVTLNVIHYPGELDPGFAAGGVSIAAQNGIAIAHAGGPIGEGAFVGGFLRTEMALNAVPLAFCVDNNGVRSSDPNKCPLGSAPGIGLQSEINGVTSLPNGYAVAGDFTDGGNASGLAAGFTDDAGTHFGRVPTAGILRARGRIAIPGPNNTFLVAGEADGKLLISRFSLGATVKSALVPALDTTFGDAGTGHVIAANVLAMVVTAGTLDNAGRLVLIVMSTAAGFPRSLVRLSPTTGLIDTAFNPQLDPNLEPRAIAVSPQGDIFLSGIVKATEKLYVAKLDTNGAPQTLDSTAGVKADDTTGDILTGGNAIALDAQGRILVSATTNRNPGFHPRLRVVRLLPTGVPDPSFGETMNGIAAIALPALISGTFLATCIDNASCPGNGNCTDAGCSTNCTTDTQCTAPGSQCGNNVCMGVQTEDRSLFVQPDGRIVLVGYASSVFASDFQIAFGPNPLVVNQPRGTAAIVGRFLP
ncbi:MAG: hypothetical protein JWM74_1125, partial [Myxococcaceae bacterium]|nr:hypothetical protein [Myxococcaceae bacterium]